MSMTSKTIKSLALAALSLAAPFAAHADATQSFVRAGTTYTYAESTVNGKRVLLGETSDGRKFRLVIGDRYVVGNVDFNPVRFSLSEIEQLKLSLR